MLDSAEAAGLSHGQAHCVAFSEHVGCGTHCRSTDSTGLRCQAGRRERAQCGCHSARSGRMSQCRGRLQGHGGRQELCGKLGATASFLNRDRSRNRNTCVLLLLLRGKVEDAARRECAEITGSGRHAKGRDKPLDVGQIRVQTQDNLLPLQRLLGNGLGEGARGGRWWRRSVLEHDLGPPLEDVIRDVQLPVDSKQECNLVLVDLMYIEARNLAPGSRGVVAVLKVLGRENQGREEHAPAALKGPVGVAVLVLLSDKATLGDVGLDKDEVVQRHLQGRVAGARAPKRLLDEGAQRQHGPGAGFRAARGRRQGPYGFHDLSGRVCGSKG